ncbi:MAG: alkaline phosphatase [Candidatus Thorarchaeota archaeon]|nr:alkaline phosphatase [Candidatus Thorarchaeota archaeon]
MKLTKTILLSILLVSLILTPTVQYSQAAEAEYPEPLSVILMIGDGMGYEHVKIAKWVEVGKNANLTMETLPYSYSVTTHSADAQITDSAAAATAYATGVKTNNNWVSIAPNGTELQTILEMAQINGKSTGVITTTTIQHATPAAFMTHVESRGDSSIITQQIIESAGVDVLMGGGSAFFSEYQIEFMVANGYSLAEDKSTLEGITSGKVLGLFSEGQMYYEQERDINLTPSIWEMTNKSLEILSQDPDGFFLMVEGGRIDHAGHENNKVSVVLETIAFDNAIEVALSYVEDHSDTILIIVADHETGGLMITGDTLNDELPSDENTEMENRNIRIARANNISVTWSTTYHTDSNVPLFIYGDVFEDYSIDDVIDNIQVFHIMDDYFSGNISEIVPPLITVERITIIAGAAAIIVLAAYFIKLRKSN